MKILTDFHHHALAESLVILFKDRFGHDVYFPAGMEWFHAGYWQFEKQFYGDKIALQYLDGIWRGATEQGPGLLVKDDPRHPGRKMYGVKLDAALSMDDWDIVISTLPHNDFGFHKFAQQKGAKFGVQIGNVGQQSRYDLAEFILSSSTLPGYQSHDDWGRIISYHERPTVIYHQEFDTTQNFYASTREAEGSRVVSSFVNCFPEKQAYPAFLSLARSTGDEFDWKVYGSYGSAAIDEFAAGDVSWVPDIASAMRNARVGFHVKHGGDGFGHVIHNWASVGRPIIWSERDYQGKIPHPLWIDGVNAWSIESRSNQEIIEVLTKLRDDQDFWYNACNVTATRFMELVDFEKEARAIGEMLEL